MVAAEDRRVGDTITVLNGRLFPVHGRIISGLFSSLSHKRSASDAIRKAMPVVV